MTYAKQRVGQLLGERYRLIQWVGGGGFADVYVAEDIKFDDERVAVKILKPEFAKRVAVEARIGRKFKHPNVVAVTDMNVDGETPFIVMEYLEGRTVDQLLPLSPPLLRKFVQDICDALQHAHEQGLVHRDLKLQNIMLIHPDTSRQQFKILDFGIAAQVNAELTLRNATMDGGGTIEYMPPEHLCSTGAKPGPKSDIYSIGVLLYELLMGRKPFLSDGQTIMTTLKMIETQPPPRFCEIDPECQIDSAVEAVVLQCLSKSPERRPENVKEIATRFLNSYAVEYSPALLDSVPATHSTTVPGIKSLPPAGHPHSSSVAPPPTPEPPPPPPATSRPNEFATLQPAQVAAAHTPAPPTERPWGETLLPSSGNKPLHASATFLPGNLPPVGKATVQTIPPRDFDQPEPPQSSFAWVRNTVLIVTLLLLVVGSAFVLVQQRVAQSRIERFAESHQWDEAVLDLEAGNVLTHPFIDRPAKLLELHVRWLADIKNLVERGKLEQAIEECKKVDENFPDDSQTSQIMRAIADQVRKKIADLVSHEEYSQAIASLSGRSVGARLAKVNGRLFDPTHEKTQILKTGLNQLTRLSQQKKYAAVISGGHKLQSAFPTDKSLDGMLRRAEIGLLLESGNAQLKAGQYEAASADYTQAILKQPDPDQWRTLLFQRATAHHQLAVPPLEEPLVQQLAPADIERLLQPLDSVFTDLKDVLTRNPGDTEAKKLRSSTLLVRASFRRRINDLPPALCDLKAALQDTPTQTGALDLLLAICGEEGDAGMQHHSKAHDMLIKHESLQRDVSTDDSPSDLADPEAVKLAADAEVEWQQAIDHLNVAIMSCEVALLTKGLAVDGRMLPLYYCRADARFRQSRPDYKGALEDLKSFRKLANDVQIADPQLNLKCVQALSLQAWIQATCGDANLRNADEAKAAADDAEKRFRSVRGAGGKLDESQLRLQSYVLQAVAAAAAAKGDFEIAIEFTEEALANLDKMTDEWQFHNSLLKHYYLRDKPYIEAVRAQSETKKLMECRAE